MSCRNTFSFLPSTRNILPFFDPPLPGVTFDITAVKKALRELVVLNKNNHSYEDCLDLLWRQYRIAPLPFLKELLQEWDDLENARDEVLPFFYLNTPSSKFADLCYHRLVEVIRAEGKLNYVWEYIATLLSANSPSRYADFLTLIKQEFPQIWQSPQQVGLLKDICQELIVFPIKNQPRLQDFYYQLLWECPDLFKKDPKVGNYNHDEVLAAHALGLLKPEKILEILPRVEPYLQEFDLFRGKEANFLNFLIQQKKPAINHFLMRQIKKIWRKRRDYLLPANLFQITVDVLQVAPHFFTQTVWQQFEKKQPTLKNEFAFLKIVQNPPVESQLLPQIGELYLEFCRQKRLEVNYLTPLFQPFLEQLNTEAANQFWQEFIYQNKNKMTITQIINLAFLTKNPAILSAARKNKKFDYDTRSLSFFLDNLEKMRDADLFNALWQEVLTKKVSTDQFSKTAYRAWATYFQKPDQLQKTLFKEFNQSENPHHFLSSLNLDSGYLPAQIQQAVARFIVEVLDRPLNSWSPRQQTARPQFLIWAAVLQIQQHHLTGTTDNWRLPF